MKTKLSARFWCALTLFSLIGQVAWVVENMYFNVFIYKMFHASAADISAMVAASAVTATITTVLIGALSDKIGKRKFFISIGSMLWGVSILSFTLLKTEWIAAAFPMAASAAAVGVSLAIILDCVMTFFGSAANDAAFNAWLTDSTDHTNRGAAEGINSMMPLVAILVVFGGFMFFDLSKADSWVWIFSIIGGAVFIIGLIGLFLIKEPAIQPVKQSYWQTLIYGFRPSTIRTFPILYITLAAFIIFNISIQIFMPYLIIYYEVSLGMTDYVLIMAPAIILAAVFTFFWGKVYDKKGFHFSGLIALTLLAAGYVLLYLCRSTTLVFIGSLLMMSGYLAGMAVFGAMIRDHTPEGKSGELQGARIFCQVFVPGILGPYIGKTVLSNAETIINSDGTASFVPNANIFLAALIALLLVLPLFWWIRSAKKPTFATLKTPFEADLTEQPYSDYPRPQMQRESYINLNGKWDLSVRRKGTTEPLGSILVPFPPEARISGIKRLTKKNEMLIYTRTFTLPDGFKRDSVWLHFGAADQYTAVYLNERLVGKNEGGYLPFSLDITDALTDGENILRVEITDPMDLNLPYGKQRYKRGGMWYTPIAGIWQTVWLESLPAQPITALKMTPTLNSITFEIEGGADKKKITLASGEEYCFDGNKLTIDFDQPHLWSPEDPYLYEFTLESGEDRIRSYFALRTIDIREINGKAMLCLNGKPYFFHGLLDQGYYSDGIYLPATPQGYINDILQMKKCGFNTLRKHIKMEPELFYYYCDQYGMIVFQDMINSGRYGFIIDTALPTLFLRKGVTHRATKQRKAHFLRIGEQMIKQLYNHPSVCYYTIFNEGWGQFEADACYTYFKALDPTHIFDTTSGWFKEQKSDVESDHIYFKPIQLKNVCGKPMVLSEFGGYSCRLPDHAFNPSKNTGYSVFTDQPTEFEEQLIALYDREILPAIEQGLCAAILTQLSDVEDETNGLLTYDRAQLKVRPEPMQKLAERLNQAFAQLK